ncbi:hypothetical protein ACFQNJ_16970 [Hydrogenophaga bisanensis]|uniref:Uncharacterized protein n=1 Tax=Hydrogenophaga bisanensis TaxID=439611 RepID=A0ABW2RDT0_9BURK
MFKPTIEITSRNELRHGIPVRFLYRGFTVARLRTGEGMCFWSACKGGSGAQANPDLAATQPTQIIDKIDAMLRLAA